jgi:mRNA interferase MazF
VAGFVKGDVVVTAFPFADLSETKRRPAMILAEADAGAVILCQITSQAVRDPDAIELTAADFQSGSLKKHSNIRPNRVFTADNRIVLYRAGHLHAAKTNEVVEKLIEILQR